MSVPARRHAGTPARPGFSVFAMRPRPFGQPRGQVAAFMIVLLAIGMIMIMFVVNIGQVALNKTRTANAADAAALTIMSSVGQIARQYGLQLGKGKKYIKSKCKFDFFNIFKIILIVVGAILMWWNPAYWVWAAGFVIAAGSVTSIAIREGLIVPSVIRKFNRQFNKLPDPRDQIREGGLLTAFLRTLDEPNRIPDARDIDEDGDRTELISPFSDWYDRRLAALVGDAEGQKPGALSKLTDLKTQLQALHDAMVTLRAQLIDPGFPAFEWTEGEGCDVTFWLPGDQSSSPDEPDDCPVCPPGADDMEDPPEIEDFCGPCGPGVGGAPDKVDWLIVQLDDFINWSEQVLELPDDQLLLIAPQLEEDIVFWVAELQVWIGQLSGWLLELNGHKLTCPVPCGA